MKRLSFALLAASTALTAGSIPAQHPTQAPTAKAKEKIQWLHPLDAALPKDGAIDSRPIILYFTYDT